MLSARGEGYLLTDAGRARAVELLRRHRLYESYLDDLGYPSDHLHEAADRVEHHLSPAMTAAINVATEHPRRDPQGKPIPRGE
ncbi:MAG TPA: iron dependent repressor, metal binding and dimerization domain protein [Armatimonadota bacterium]|nr:iron dependent repressor, metal binding and dimerization domain protein [Armatimonadota bacterium]